jgi:hypothetical protein
MKIRRLVSRSSPTLAKYLIYVVYVAIKRVTSRVALINNVQGNPKNRFTIMCHILVLGRMSVLYFYYDLLHHEFVRTVVSVGSQSVTKSIH